jgi:integrase
VVAEMRAKRGTPAAGALFVTPTGRPLYHMYLYRLARTAELPAAERLTPHALRHAAITLYLQRTNGNVRGAQLFAGHARPKTTMRYDRSSRGLSARLAARFGTSAQVGRVPD